MSIVRRGLVLLTALLAFCAPYALRLSTSPRSTHTESSRWRMGTAIAIIRTHQWVVIAADSVAVDEFGRASGHECKIRRIGNFVYFPNKFTEDSASQYNLHRIVEDSRERESIGALAKALKNEIPAPLIKSLTAARARNPATFRSNFSTRQALGVALAGIDAGRPSLVDLRFFIEDLESSSIKLRIEEHRCPGADCPNSVGTVFVGPEHIQQRFAKEYPNYWTGDADTLAKKGEAFVQMVIDTREPDVGPPISVLLIGPNGLEWRKPCDPDQ